MMENVTTDWTAYQHMLERRELCRGKVFTYSFAHWPKELRRRDKFEDHFPFPVIPNGSASSATKLPHHSGASLVFPMLTNYHFKTYLMHLLLLLALSEWAPENTAQTRPGFKSQGWFLDQGF
uniref:Uncharacterized protein n=1 Tax=Sphaerodactylus townsendi TaxID=933632 RepID=A0ACB8E6A9_9SAUR